jgi:hypothetical protein
MKKILFIAFFCLFYVSCALWTPFNNQYKFSPQISVDSVIPNLELEDPIGEIASKLCPYVSGKMVIVTDFVDISTLKPGKSGLLLGELLKSKLSEMCKTKVIQVEFSKYFTIGQNGFRVLSRDITEIRKISQPVTTAVVGTYHLSQNKLFLFVRVVDVNSGIIPFFTEKKIDYQVEGFTIYQ